MNKEVLQSIEKEIEIEYSLKLKKVRKEYLKTSAFQVGDFVEIFFESRDFGKERVKGVIKFLGIRHHGYLGFMYYFSKVNKNGKESKHPLCLPKYSKIYKMEKL